MTRTIKLTLQAFGLLFLGVLLTLGSAYSQSQSLTGQQILEKIDERGGLGGVGSQISFSIFEVLDKTGAIQRKNFIFFSKNSSDVQIPNRVLIYFLEPPSETCGTIFLSVDRKAVGQKADLYLYLPALGQTKQLISTGERKGSFADSNVQFDQIGRSEFHSDFNAELIGEETLSVTVNGREQDRKTFLLHLTANPDTSRDESFPDRKVWVDEEEFMTLKSEDTNTVGKLQNMTTLDDLITFKERLEPSIIKVVNLLDNSSTTVTITDREDIGDLPDGIFDPNSLAQFDPKQFNTQLQVKVPNPTCP